MARKLTAGEARATFEELAKELPKQHLRLQFRKRFGTGQLLDPKMLKKATVVVARDKPVSNLLQEVPEKILCRRLLGTAEEVRGDEWETQPDAQVGQLFSPEEVEQGLLVQGRKARIFVYADPTEETVYVLRVATELFGDEEPKPKAKPTRKQRAGKATAKPRRPSPRGRGKR